MCPLLNRIHSCRECNISNVELHAQKHDTQFQDLKACPFNDCEYVSTEIRKVGNHLVDAFNKDEHDVLQIVEIPTDH